MALLNHAAGSVVHAKGLQGVNTQVCAVSKQRVRVSCLRGSLRVSVTPTRGDCLLPPVYAADTGSSYMI
jgi:hypothetical protein